MGWDSALAINTKQEGDKVLGQHPYTLAWHPIEEFEHRHPAQPRDIDLSDSLQNTFGCVEYERAITKIVKYLDSDHDLSKTNDWLFKPTELMPLGCYQPGEGWYKLFRINTLPIDPALFAMLCADGWIDACHFPKYTFSLSEKARYRLRNRITSRL